MIESVARVSWLVGWYLLSTASTLVAVVGTLAAANFAIAVRRSRVRAPYLTAAAACCAVVALATSLAVVGYGHVGRLAAADEWSKTQEHHIDTASLAKAYDVHIERMDGDKVLARIGKATTASDCTLRRYPAGEHVVAAPNGTEVTFTDTDIRLFCNGAEVPKR